jgi:tryptophanyl-tRNA synthetase
MNSNIDHRSSIIQRPRLISGIQPTGKLHLGNYVGALQNFVKLQNSGDYDCYFFIADYHSLTKTFTPSEKRAQIHELAVDYLAVGLDPRKSTIFLQSDVPSTTELAWMLSCITPFGELRRMTQFKDKSEGEPENINVGLFSYPVLMAADILLYDAGFVPVGFDQLQHLELARTLARKFNHTYGVTLIEPKPLLTDTPKLASLDAPEKKMSKSRPNGCIFLDDTPEAIERKTKTAVTDSGNEIRFDPEHKPGISNMLLIMANLSGKSIPDIEEAFQGQNYSEFKHALADCIADHFKNFREAKAQLAKKPEALAKMLTAGAKKADAIAAEKIAIVKQRIGLAK